MIICHPLKLIFVKTKKVGGTSFEIALSSLCCENSIITPISPDDEALRVKIGCPGAQNYENPVWKDDEGAVYHQTQGVFYNHIPAPDARGLIPDDVWNSYRKITIVRDPFDVAISLYFFEGWHKRGVDFGQFVEHGGQRLLANGIIAPMDGPGKLDDYLCYERISQEVHGLGVPGLGDLFDAIKAKGNRRPREGASIQEIYTKFPKAADQVTALCRGQIDGFGYTHPLSRAA